MGHLSRRPGDKERGNQMKGRSHKKGSAFTSIEGNQTVGRAGGSWGEDKSYLLKNKKKESHYTIISNFTQTLYLDYRHYVPIKHKRKVMHFKTLPRICILPFREKKETKGKIKIYYHLLKILLKINKTQTQTKHNKKAPLCLFHFISLRLSRSFQLGWPTLWGGGSWENSFAYKLWEAGIVIGGTLDASSAKGEDFHVQISASPTLCIIISSAPKKETPPIPKSCHHPHGHFKIQTKSPCRASSPEGLTTG